MMLLIPFCWVIPVQAQSATPNVTGQAAIAVDASTGLITYAKNIHRRAPMASTTKIMTALTALDTLGTDLNETYTVVKEDLIGEASMGLRAGEVVTFSDLLYGMLLNSGNDAAEAIARYAGSKLPGEGNPVDRFVAHMNSQATALGLRNTHYANPHGLDQTDHYSSPFDLAITGWYALHNPTLAKIVSQQQATVAGHGLVNINTFLKRYSGANGIKPGFTDGAGLCLVASATRNGQTALAVVMNTDQAGFTNDAATMLNFTFELPEAVKNPSSGGGPINSTAQYIGYPKGNLLMSAQGANAEVFGNFQSTRLDLNEPKSAIAAQISTAYSSTIAPAPTATNISGENSITPPATNSAKQNSGPNFFVVLLIFLILVSILFGLGRAGYLGGETGRNTALWLEDMVMIAVRFTQHGLKRLFVALKPGNHPDEAATPPVSRNLPTSRSSSPTGYRERVNPNPRTIENTRPSTTSKSGTAQNPSRPRPTPPEQVADNNPLDGFFDELQPFALEDNQAISEQPEVRPEVKSPQPLPPAPNIAPLTNRVPTQPERERENPLPNSRMSNHANRTAAEPKQKPDLNSPIDRLRPAQPLSQRPPLSQPPTRSEKTERGNDRNFFGTPTGGADSLGARARQAIDYAYAGRLQASTDEFRKVVEYDPLFDFGGLEEFDQMPVLGYKALANAYSATGRQKFALLLLEMGIDKYPNDLELRNMLRTFKREIGQQ